MALTISLSESDVLSSVEVDVYSLGVVVIEIQTVVSGTMANCASCSFFLSSFSNSTSMSLIWLFY